MDESSLKDWLESLAAKQPTPGGGAVAALSAALSAGLLGMVSIYTTGPKWQDRTERMQALHEELAKLRLAALELVTADATAFARVGAAYQLPKETEEQKAARTSTIQEALVGAAEPPRLTAELAAKLVVLAEELVPVGNPNVISDVAVASSNARASLESAIVNIEINQSLITDKTIKDQLKSVIEQAELSIHKADAVTMAVRQRIQAA